MAKRMVLYLLTALLGLAWPAAISCSRPIRLNEIKLPKGFQIEIYADEVPGARSMTLSPAGILFVGSRAPGKVYAVRPDSRKVTVLARGLNMPNGVAFRDGALYVAEINRVIKFEDIEARLDKPPPAVVVNDRLPTDRRHGLKFIRFGPDGLLYVPVGAPCNSCEIADPYGALLRMRPDGGGLEVFARGIRNTVGFDWHPRSRELWFTDNGRDWLGDDRPPDELNRAPAPGLHFGFPYWHGQDIAEPDLAPRLKRADFTPPALELGAHVAALGMRFYTGAMFPVAYRNRIFIAEHGSWNRSVPVGYRVMLVRLRNNEAVSYEVFAEGWLQGYQAWGRPVDLLVMPDGALLVSDDQAGVVYRISYR